MPDPRTQLTLVCLASYFKGGAFLEESHERGHHVVLVTREELASADWPWPAIDDVLTVPDDGGLDDYISAVCAIARGRAIDRIVALEEYDVMPAAAIREHLALPGLGVSTARRFRDKLTMRVAASRAGIRVPEFAALINRADIEDFLRRHPAPWVIKPRTEVAAMGIRRVDTAEEALRVIDELDARAALNERASYHLLERFVEGDVYHVDGLVAAGRVLFAGAHRYHVPPLRIASDGGVFLTGTVPRRSAEEAELLAANASIVDALGIDRSATHVELIRSAADGRLYFLEAAARVGGAYIADMLEAATGVNLWRAWAALETSPDDVPVAPVPSRDEYAGIALALSRDEWPDTSGFTDPEIVHRVTKRHHIGLIVRSPEAERVSALLQDYERRFREGYLAVLPALEKPR